MMIVCSIVLKRFTNPSMIYHWIRGQSLFKLYMIKAVNEIVDLLLKGYGHGIMENFSRAMKTRNGLDWIIASFGVMIYSLIHSFILTMEMFTLHVVLTSSPPSIYSFLFYNNFTEVKITVFKKCDAFGLYQYACNDSVERF